MYASRSARSRVASAGSKATGAPRRAPRLVRSLPRRGIALPIALASIVTIGALISGVVFAATQEARVGRNTMTAQQASIAAELGIGRVVSSWTSERTATTKVGQTVTMNPETVNGAVVQAQYTRVSPTVFVVTSTAVAGGEPRQGRAVWRVGTVLQAVIPDLMIEGALTARGKVNATGAATISGNDTTPPGWDDCVSPGTPMAGIVVGDSATNMTSSGECAGLKCLYGEPKVADSSVYADSLTYQNFGAFSYDSLTKLASPDKIYTSSFTIDQRRPVFNPDGSCNRTDPRNWGDTSRVRGPAGCRDYTPVVWLKGTTASWTVSNFGGQGILLVDGNVTFNGKFGWTGLIIVQGTVAFAGEENPPRIIGAVLAMNRKNGTHMVQGKAMVRFSRCAIQAVTTRIAGVRPMRYRAWTDMSF